MEIYNEQMAPVENPDLRLGWLEDSVQGDARGDFGGSGGLTLRDGGGVPERGRDVARVVDVPGVAAQAAWDEEIPIQIYVPYTQEELDRMEAKRNKPAMEDRLIALEEENIQLKEALNAIIRGIADA